MRPHGALIPVLIALTACTRPAAAPAVAPASAPWVAYVCEDGRRLEAQYPNTSTAMLRLDGREIELRVAVSGSGARFTGGGQQWWIKGDAGTLAPLAPDETIASAAGIQCGPPGTISGTPPAPGAPGGLPDDRTPLDERPADPKSPQAAATVVETYYALLESGRAQDAARLRSDGEAEAVGPKGEIHAQVGAPGPAEGAAGSIYVDVPVVVYGRKPDGSPLRASGVVTVRRVNDVPGATAEQLRWRISRIVLN